MKSAQDDRLLSANDVINLIFKMAPRLIKRVYSVTKIIPTCSPVIGQFFDTTLVASIDKEWL